MKTLYLAGGCFWGLEKFFQQFKGVEETQVGYANGPTINPTYQEVCQSVGHAETVKVVYDERRLSTKRLLELYFMTIDPTSLNRQGHDIGVQYRTGIYYEDESLLPEIQEVYQKVEQEVGKRLAVEVEPLQIFAPAEEYHQNYLNKNPGGYCHIPPEMFKLGWKELFRDPEA